LIVNEGTLAMQPRNVNGALRVLQIVALSIKPGARLDLNDNDLTVSNGNFAELQAWVIAGFGNPLASGIVSTSSEGSQILALFDNALVGATEWNGLPIDSNAVVGKYTYFGDVNLDGQVTGDDYTVIDSNLNTAPPAGLEWVSGDANLDGSVTGDDYTTIDSNLGLGTGNPLTATALEGISAGSLSAVPEPTAASLIASSAVLLYRLRRNQRPR
jgi:hypothetical protein